MEYNIERLREELPRIRAVAGWTQKRLADEIGLSRESIIFLEARKTPMKKIHYMAIMYAFLNEAVATKNDNLVNTIRMLVIGTGEGKEYDAFLQSALHEMIDMAIKDYRKGKKKGAGTLKNALNLKIEEFMEGYRYEVH